MSETYRKLQAWRWIGLIFNLIVATTHLLVPKWGAPFFVLFHVGLGWLTFWVCTRCSHELIRRQAELKLTQCSSKSEQKCAPTR